MLKFIIQLSLFTLLISSSTFSGIVQSTTTGGNWNSTSTWQGGAVPIDNDDVIIATTGANSVVVNVNTAKIGSLVINSGSILQGGGSFTLLVGGTSGNDVLNNGTIEAINITVKLQSHSTFVGNGTYNLYRIDFNGKNLTLRSSSPDTLHFSAPGDPFTNIGNLLDTGWVFDYNGTSVQYLSDDNEAYFDHIDISNSAGVRLLQNLTTTYLRGNLVVRPGAILHTGSYTITGSSGKIFALDSNATFNDSVTFPTGFSTYSLNVASTVNYMSVGSQTISSTPAYGNLTFSGGGTKTAGGDLTVNGNFTMGGSTTFNGGTSRSHTFKGDWTNNSSAGTPFTYTTASTIIMATPSTPTSTAFGGSTSATTAFNNFTVSNTSGVTASKNFSSSGTFSIQSNATFTPDASVIVSGTGALTVTGTLKVTRTSVTANLVNQYTLSGTKTLTGGTVDFAGTGEIVDNLSYGNLTISGTASINSTFSVVPTGNFIVTGTATLNASQTSAFGGNTTVSGTGILDITAVTFSQSGRTLTLSTGGTLKTSGTFPTFSTYSLTGGTVEYYGTASQSVSAQSYGNLSLSGARTTNSITVPSSTMFISGTFSPTATFSSGNYIITGNTIDFNGSGSQIIPAFNYNNLTSSSSGGRTLASSGTIGISGVFTPGTNSYTNTGSTINFNGSGTQTISAFNYNNLTSSSSGTRILSSSGTIGIAEVFTQGSNSYTIAGSTIDFNGSGSQTIPAFTYQNLISSSSGARTLASSGTITLNGAFTPGTNSYTVTGSTISYVSSSSQAIASFSYNNLTIAGSGNQTADGDITTNGVLSLNNNLDMGSNTLTMGSASTTLGTYDVKGKVRRTSFTPSTEYTFGNRYTSVTFGSGGTFPTQIDVTISIGAAPSGKSDAILRSYVITATGGSGYSSTLRLHYLNGELNGNTPTQLSLWKFITSWNDLGRLGSVDTTSNYAELDGISSFETFTLANASLDHFDVSFNSPQTVGTAFTGTNTITARDQNNNLLTTYSAAANNVSVTSTPTDGTIYGLGSGNNAVLNQAENFVNGVCSVTSQLLFIGTNGNHTFTATSSNGKTGTSGTVTLETGTAVRLAFSTQPGDGIERQNLSAQPQVTIQDTGGNTVTTASNSVSLAIANNPSGGSLSTDSNPLNATSGVATFSGVRINKAGTGYTLSATTSGLTSATSSTFTISNQTPTITTISPMNKARGDDGFTITISGTRFVYNSVVQYAGSNRTTTFFNDSVLTAEITASDLFTAGIYGITVVNPAPGGGTSNEVSFTVLTASISGTVISDSNGNGSREGFESGLQNWRVRLAKNGVPFDSVLSDGSGNFSFTSLGIGTYTLTQLIQTNWIQTFPTSPASYTLIVSSGGTIIFAGNDFGNFRLATISGEKFNDANGDGIKNGFETGLENWKIKITGPRNDSTLTLSNGSYSFTNLTAGEYTVSEEIQPGWMQTMPVSPGTYTVNVVTGSNFSNTTFGNFQSGIISGRKFNDVNGNGFREGGEPNLSGWKIYLYKTDTLTLFDSTTSTFSGYSFVGLSVGTYFIREVPQAGWIQTTANPSPIVVTSGTNIGNVDIGNFQFGTISGTVFHDQNNNNVKDIGEPVLENWKVKISGFITDSILSNVNGEYAFTNLRSGNYTVNEEVQTGWTQSSPSSPGSYFLSIVSGTVHSNKDFGNVRLGAISGLVFLDKNSDGVKNENENGIADWKIKISGSKNDSTLTDSTGNYSFINLPLGGYTVSEVLPIGWIQTFPSSPGIYPLNVTSGSNFTGIDFGNFQITSLSGVVFLDNNSNGLKDLGEQGLPDWTLKISGEIIDSTTSDLNGNYNILAIPIGEYILSGVIKENWTQTFPTSPSTYSVTIDTFTNLTGLNFGNYEYGSISGVSFNDVNGNGFREGNEGNLSGWQIYLYKDDSLTVSDSLTTTESGYSFDSLLAGTYYIREVPQDNWILTSGIPAPNVVTSGFSSSTENFGNFRLAYFSGNVFVDLNVDGIRDEGELGLPDRLIRISGSEIDSTLSDANGNFIFDSLHSGSYILSEVLPVGWKQSLPSLPTSYFLSALSGDSLTALDFGNFQLGLISGTVFDDINGNSVKDVDEPGIRDWRLTIFGAKRDTALTDSNGNYSFKNLLPGGYLVNEVLQTNWVLTFPQELGFYILDISTSGINYTRNNFGVFRRGGITGIVYSDKNANGIYEPDSAEVPQSGWTVNLSGALVRSTVTNDSGYFEFTGLATGVYNVTETNQPGWSQSYPPNQGGAYTIAMESGREFGNTNFGNYGGKIRLRTFAATSLLAQKPVKLKYNSKTKAIVGTPNLATAVQAVFQKLGKKGGVFLGIEQTTKDSAKKYGWIAYNKGATLGKLFTAPHTGQAYPIDYFRAPGKANKKLVKGIKADKKRYDNPAWEQGVLFRLNLYASQYGITPEGLGTLEVLSSPYVIAGRSLSNLTLNQVGQIYDTLMTYWERNEITTQVAYTNLQTFVTEYLKPINDGFATDFNSSTYEIDTAAVKSKNGYGIKLKGYKTASDVGIVRELPSKINTNFEETNPNVNIPFTFSLEQNYPNPFNPATTIEFSLPKASVVHLSIFNVLGQRVLNVLDEIYHDEGMHEVLIEANSLPSGVYFYRLQATELQEDEINTTGHTNVSVKKMVLMK